MDVSTRPIVTEELVQEKPWRYIGYRGFSEWMSSDDDFFVLRRFDGLAARTLLLMQWKITLLENQLLDADNLRSYDVVTDLHNGSFAADDAERQAVLSKIKTHLTEYYGLIDVYSNLRNKPRSTKASIENVRTWLSNHPKAIRMEETEFIDQEDELFNVRDTGRSPLRRWLESIHIFRNAKVFRRVHNPRSTIPTLHDPTKTMYHRNGRIENTVDTLICGGGFVILVAPLWILFVLQSRTYQLAVITLCSALFLTLVQSVSTARPFESLGATAAYTAVLMVFMQINPAGNS